MYTGVNQVLEVLAMAGPVLDLFDRALDLAARHGDGTTDFGDQNPTQPLLVLLQRLVQLGQAVVAELEITRPLAGVECPPRRADRPLHVRDGAVGGLPRDLLAGRVDHVECRAAARQLQLAVDEHPLVAGQYARLGLHSRHGRSALQTMAEMSAVVLDPDGMAQLRKELVGVVAANDVMRDRNANCGGRLDRCVWSGQ